MLLSYIALPVASQLRETAASNGHFAAVHLDEAGTNRRSIRVNEDVGLLRKLRP